MPLDLFHQTFFIIGVVLVTLTFISGKIVTPGLKVLKIEEVIFYIKNKKSYLSKKNFFFFFNNLTLKLSENKKKYTEH